MITHISHIYSGPEFLKHTLHRYDFTHAANVASSILIQVYTAKVNIEEIREILDFLSLKLPRATIVGATSAGEITCGRLLSKKTVIGFTFFMSSSISSIALTCRHGEELSVGKELRRTISHFPAPVRGVLLVTTPIIIDTAVVLQGVQCENSDYVIFGGGAADYATMENSLVFHSNNIYTNAIIAVAFSGSDLHIESKSHLGWSPLSMAMKITSAERNIVKTVEHKPAFEVYKRFLGIENDKDFFINALAFPFLIDRHGEKIARTPAHVTPDGSLHFSADIHKGETFRLGYADLGEITENVRDIHENLSKTFPHVIFLYSCCSRRYFMQQDVEAETLPFQDIAPTFGFFTYEEYHGTTRLSVLNSTLVAVTLREGNELGRKKIDYIPIAKNSLQVLDPFIEKQISITARLTKFIRVVTDALEKANIELQRLAITDSLTKLANRMRIDLALEEFVGRALRYGTPLSIIMLDIDHFKLVNDNHGHLTGDSVLEKLASILVENTRSVDVPGRWGGEEFIIIAPSVNSTEALILANKLRLAIETTEFPLVKHITASFGVACFQPGDNISSLLDRADKALYGAKQGGRNQVVLHKSLPAPSQPPIRREPSRK